MKPIPKPIRPYLGPPPMVSRFESIKFYYNNVVTTNPLVGDTAAGHSWPSIGGESYTPTLCLAVWHAFQ